MRELKQPLGSNLCGQTCVAMLADTSIEAVCHLMRTRGKTRTRDVVRALRYYGFTVPNRLIRVMDTIEPLPKTCIVKVPHARGWHWMLFYEGRVYDPGTPLCLGRVTSYLPVMRGR
jgi:hypothetical protein